MDENTQQVITQLGDKLDSYINILAEKLGVAAEYVYPLFVKQQMIEGISTLSLIMLCCITSIICLIFGVKGGNKKNWGDGGYVILIFTGGIMGIISICALGHNFTDCISQIMNPEYAAIQDIIQMVK